VHIKKSFEQFNFEDDPFREDERPDLPRPDLIIDEFRWCHETLYYPSDIRKVTDPNNYYYIITLSVPGEFYKMITCKYWNTKNILRIYKSDSKTISFFVNNFNDVMAIVRPMVQAENEYQLMPKYRANR